MQRDVLEVVEGTVGFERAETLIGDDGEGEARRVLRLRESLVQAGRGVGAHGDDLDARLGVLRGERGENIELLDAVRAAAAKVKDDEHGLALVVGERVRFAVAVGQAPRRRAVRVPAERAELGDVRAHAGVGGRGRGQAPVFGQLEILGDGRELLEDGQVDVDLRGELPQFLKRRARPVLVSRAPEHAGEIRQRLHLRRVGVAGLLREFHGFVFVANREVDARPPLRRDVARGFEQRLHRVGPRVVERLVDFHFRNRRLRRGERIRETAQRVGHRFRRHIAGFFFRLRFRLCGIRRSDAISAHLDQQSLQRLQLALAFLRFPCAEVRHAQRRQPPRLDLRLFVLCQIDRAFERGEVAPHFKSHQRLQQPLAPEVVGLAVRGIEPRQLHEIHREIHGILHAADVGEVLHQPVVVVRVVVDLLRHDPRRGHVGVVGARRRLLLPRGVGVAVQIGIRVVRHVPHVGDARRGLPAMRRRGQRPLVALRAIPQVDEIVAHRMRRIHREHLLRERIHRQPARERRAVLRVVPELENEERLRFEVVGKFVDQFLQRLHQRLALFALVLFRVGIKFRPRLDPQQLAAARLVLLRVRQLDEIRRAFRVVDVRHRHAPVGRRAVRIQRRHLPERPLRLEVPEPVQLPHALREKLLRQLVLRRHGEAHIARPRHQHRRLARAFVESLAVQRVAGELGFIGLRGRRVLRAESGESEREGAGEGCETHGSLDGRCGMLHGDDVERGERHLAVVVEADGDTGLPRIDVGVLVARHKVTLAGAGHDGERLERPRVEQVSDVSDHAAETSKGRRTHKRPRD